MWITSIEVMQEVAICFKIYPLLRSLFLAQYITVYSYINEQGEKCH